MISYCSTVWIFHRGKILPLSLLSCCGLSSVISCVSLTTSQDILLLGVSLRYSLRTDKSVNKSICQKLILLNFHFIYFLRILLVSNLSFNSQTKYQRINSMLIYIRRGASLFVAPLIHCKIDEINVFWTFLQKENLCKKWWMKLFGEYLIMMVSFSCTCIYVKNEFSLW